MTKKDFMIVIISIIIFLALFEITLRLFYPQPVFLMNAEEASPKIFETGDSIPWTLKKNASERHMNIIGEWDVTVKTNSLGLRDDEIIEDGRKKVLILGDSFTFGYGVENNETYAALLEKKLNGSVDVINAGYASGYSMDTEYVYLKNHGLKLRPDAVILGFFIGNDVADINANEWDIDDKGEIKKVKSNTYYIDDYNRLRVSGLEMSWYYDYNIYLTRNSHAYTFFKNRLKHIKESFETADNTIYNNEYDERMKNNINKTRELIIKMNNLTNENNASLLVLFIPSKEQVYGAKIYDKNRNLLDLERINIEFLDFFTKNNIKVLYLLPYMRDEKGIFFNVDPHWNKNGHELAASIIFESLINTCEPKKNYA